MADCAFCPPDARRFRTARQCANCGTALCLVCRPAIPAIPFLCPNCGGGERENTLKDPARTIARLQAAGLTVPYWLEILQLRITAEKVKVDDELIPE